MADDPTEEMVKREIAAARKILQEDRHAAGLKSLQDRFDKHYPDNSDGGDGDGDTPKPPPAVPPADKPVKRGVWWGEPSE